MRFYLPSEMAPGVYRKGRGILRADMVHDFAPGERLNAGFVPLDAEAYAALKKVFGAAAKPIDKRFLEEAAPDKKGDQLTLRELASTGTRAADK